VLFFVGSCKYITYKAQSKAKATTIKDAIKRWEEKTGSSAAEATEVSLCFQWLPIEKMDNSLAVLTKCERLSLSTNMIEKIAGISSLKNLKVLSVGRNYIKNFSGLQNVLHLVVVLFFLTINVFFSDKLFMFLIYCHLRP
ncbi:Dynein light chain 1, partial [Blattella germanica]